MYVHIWTTWSLTHLHTLHPQACPFTLEVFTEDCEGEIEIVDLLSFNPIIDPALCRFVMERGVCGEVRDGSGDLLMYTFTTPHLTTIAVENKVNLYTGFVEGPTKNVHGIYNLACTTSIASRGCCLQIAA